MGLRGGDRVLDALGWIFEAHVGKAALDAAHLLGLLEDVEGRVALLGYLGFNPRRHFACQRDEAAALDLGQTAGEGDRQKALVELEGETTRRVALEPRDE